MRDPTQRDLALRPFETPSPKPDFSFNGLALTVLLDAERKPWFIPREVGEAIGYADPTKMAERITARWADDLEPGDDFIRFTHAALVAKFPTPHKEGSDFNSRGMTLLTEQGLYGVLMLARAPQSRAFRKWVRSDVLPQIARSGSYSPHREVDPNGALRIREGEIEIEKLRLQLQMAQIQAQAQAKSQDIEHSTAKAKALADLTDCVDGLGVNAVNALKIRSVEVFTGEDLAAYLPRLSAVHSPTSMGHAFGVTARRVGMVISKLELRGVEGMSEAILNTKLNGGGHVKSWLYTDEAYALIEAAVKAWQAEQ